MEPPTVHEPTGLLDLENIEVNEFQALRPWLQFGQAERDDSRPIEAIRRDDGLSIS